MRYWKKELLTTKVVEPEIISYIITLITLFQVAATLTYLSVNYSSIEKEETKLS